MVSPKLAEAFWGRKNYFVPNHSFHFNSIQFSRYLLTFRINSLSAKYKASTTTIIIIIIIIISVKHEVLRHKNTTHRDG